MGPTTPSCKHEGLGCSAFARRYWRNHFCFLFLEVLRWFTSLGCLHWPYGFGPGYSRMNASGLPHSEIPGSKPVCGSPELFAAYHVLHRHLSPRHSPYALSSLTINMRTHTGCRSAFATLRRCESFSAHCVLSVWSEKTTVCRIFSCKRAKTS